MQIVETSAGATAPLALITGEAMEVRGTLIAGGLRISGEGMVGTAMTGGVLIMEGTSGVSLC